MCNLESCINAYTLAEPQKMNHPWILPWKPALPETPMRRNVEGIQTFQDKISFSSFRQRSKEVEQGFYIDPSKCGIKNQLMPRRNLKLT